MNLSKLVATGILLFGFFATAAQSQMVGVQIVCDKDNNFLAFNFVANRIWMGKGVFQNGQMADHMENVQIAPQRSRRFVVTYKGDFQMDFGNGQKIPIQYSGVLYMDKIPMETTVSALIAGQTKTVTLFCKSN
jgi:hypothetical protein